MQAGKLDKPLWVVSVAHWEQESVAQRTLALCSPLNWHRLQTLKCHLHLLVLGCPAKVLFADMLAACSLIGLSIVTLSCVQQLWL